jgi:predicted dehydrogenase
MAIHTFDAARYVSNSDPVSVWCEDFNTPWSWWTGHGSAVAVFEMSGGLRFTYRGSWSAQGFGTTWESSWRAIAGSGTVLWDGAEIPQAEVMERPGDLTSPRVRIDGLLDDHMVTGLEGSLDAFLTALDTGVPPMGECHDNIKSLAMVLGAVRSAETGQRVPIGRLLGD